MNPKLFDLHDWVCVRWECDSPSRAFQRVNWNSYHQRALKSETQRVKKKKPVKTHRKIYTHMPENAGRLSSVLSQTANAEATTPQLKFPVLCLKFNFGFQSWVYQDSVWLRSMSRTLWWNFARRPASNTARLGLCLAWAKKIITILSPTSNPTGEFMHWMTLKLKLKALTRGSSSLPSIGAWWTELIPISGWSKRLWPNLFDFIVCTSTWRNKVARLIVVCCCFIDRSKISEREWWRRLIRGECRTRTTSRNISGPVMTFTLYTDWLFLFTRLLWNTFSSFITFRFSGTFAAHPLTDEKVNNMTTYLLDLYKSRINLGLIDKYLIATVLF